MTRVFIYSPLRILTGGHGYSYIFSPGTFSSGVLICELITQEEETKKKSIHCGLPGQGGFRWKDSQLFDTISWKWVSKSQSILRFPFEWSGCGIEDFGTFFENVYICSSVTQTSYIHCKWEVDNGTDEYDSYVEATWRWLASINNCVRAVVRVDGEAYAVGSRCLGDKFIEWRSYWKPKKRVSQVEWMFELPPGTTVKIQKIMVCYHNKIFSTSQNVHELPEVPHDFIYPQHLTPIQLKKGFKSNINIPFNSFYDRIYLPLFSNIWDKHAIEDNFENTFIDTDEDMQYTFKQIEDDSSDSSKHASPIAGVASPIADVASVDDTCTPLYIMSNWEEHVGIRNEIPFVSIIILFRGTSTSLLRRSLWSLEQQTLSKDKFDVYILFDGNKTVSFSSLDGQIPPNLQVHMYSFLKWQGICRMNRFVLGHVKGEYIGWLDHDDTLEPTCLEEIIHEYDNKRDKPMFVYTNFNYCDQKGNFLRSGYGRQPKKSLLVEQCGNHFRTVPVHIAKRLPLFHDDLCFGSEDQDMLFLMEQLSSPKCIEKPLYNYYQNTSNNSLSKNKSISVWLLQWSLLRNVYFRKVLNIFCTFIETRECPSNRSVSVFELVHNRVSLKLYITNGVDYVPLRLSSTVVQQWVSYFNSNTILNVDVQWDPSQLSWIPLQTEKHWSLPHQLERLSFSQGIFPGAYWDLVVLWTDTLLDGAMIEFGNHIRVEWGCKVEIWGPWDWTEQMSIPRISTKCLFWYFRSKEQEMPILENHVQWGQWLRSCPIDWKVQIYNATYQGKLEVETDEWALAEYNNLTGIHAHLLGIDSHAWEWLSTWVTKETNGKVRLIELQDAILLRLCVRYHERHRGEVLFRFKSSLHLKTLENGASSLVSNEQLLNINT